MLTSGELLVRHVGINDIQLRFNCYVRRLLNGELVSNRIAAKILIYGKLLFAKYFYIQILSNSNSNRTYVHMNIKELFQNDSYHFNLKYSSSFGSKLIIEQKQNKKKNF